VDMRHWTASWLKREHYALCKKLPWEYARGWPWPFAAPGMPKNYSNANKLVTEDCIQPIITSLSRIPRLRKR
jgi:hypothetical protein